MIKNIFDHSENYASVLSEQDDIVLYYGEETKDSDNEIYLVMVYKDKTTHKISKKELIESFDLQENDSPIAFLIAGMYSCIVKEIEMKKTIVNYLTSQ